MQRRRDFFASVSGAMAAALPLKADSAPASAAGEWRNRQSGVAYRRLGRTGFMISEVVMGGNTIQPDRYEHVLMALDMGLNYLDTAPAYGKGASELGYAKVLKARRRDRCFLTTKITLWDQNRNTLYRKIFDSLPADEQARLKSEAAEDLARRHALEPDYFGNYFPGQQRELEDAALANVMAPKYSARIDRQKEFKQTILKSLDESLARLETDHVDLLMCPHGASSGWELLHHPEIFEAFEILKKQGKVRHLGVSAHNDPAGILEAAMATKVYSAAMVAYSIVNHRYVGATLERARQADFGVIAMKVARPLHHGREVSQPDDPRRVKLIQDAIPGPLKVPQKAYVWALQNANLSAVISEMVSAEHVRDNLPLARQKS